MRIFRTLTDPALVKLLVDGGVGVLPTDTLYGIVTRAYDVAAFARLYTIRGRNAAKPSIVLVTSVSQIDGFNNWNDAEKQLATRYWPGPLTIVVDRAPQTPAYLADPATNKISYRLPAQPELCKLLAKTGPLIAPSANPEGQPPAATIAEAQAYFGQAIDFYVDHGRIQSTVPSTVVAVKDGAVRVLRPGALSVV